MSKIKIKPIMAIVCDEARQENNGKPFLIGIYTGGINIETTNVPATLPDGTNVGVALNVCLWIPFEAKEKGNALINIRLIGPGENNNVGVKMKLEISNLPQSTEITPLVIGPLPIKITESGDIKILFKNDDDDDWDILRIMPVTYKKTESPDFKMELNTAASSQPS